MKASVELASQDATARQELIAAHQSMMSQLNKQKALIGSNSNRSGENWPKTGNVSRLLRVQSGW